MDHKVSLVSFDLGGQEYALPLDRVQEIIQLPDRISEVARSETAVLGVVTLRDRLLPLVSLRALLGLLPTASARSPARSSCFPWAAGLSAWSPTVPAKSSTSIPAASTRRHRCSRAGRATRKSLQSAASITESDLVAVLSPDRLFRSDLVRRVLSEQGQQSRRQGKPNRRECNG